MLLTSLTMGVFYPDPHDRGTAQYQESNTKGTKWNAAIGY